MGKKIFLLCCIFICNTIFSNNFKLGLVDTTHNQKYRYNQFIKICESVGYNVDYISLSQIIDNSIDTKQYNGILFVLDIEFLKGMAHSPISYKILNLIKEFAKQKNKLIGIALPTIGGKIPHKTRLFLPILKRVGLNINAKSFELNNIPDSTENNIDNIKNINKSLEEFFWATNRFLDIPLEARSFLYHTTLNEPRKRNFSSYASKYNTHYCILPRKNSLPFRLAPTLPYGIYFYNPIKKNNIFLTSTSLLYSLDINENFHFCPFEKKYKEKILNLIQETMWELKIIVKQEHSKKISFSQMNKLTKPNLPKLLINKTKAKSNNLKNLKKVAWMEIYMFEKDDEKSKKQQDLLISSILKPGPDLYLWITLNPHMYYSPIAKIKDKTKTFWKSLSLFTKKLAKTANKLKIIPPKILIGYEITNNVYNPNLPKDYAVDIYGNEYKDLPNPIDNNFWDNEIKKPLTDFLKEYKKSNINNGIKIAGVVLDLEMYCRKTTGAFLDSMGFCKNNIKKFCKQNKIKTNNTNISYLIKNKLMQKYFDFLTEQANLLGQNLKNFFCKNINNCKIACYAPNISTNWFYKDFYSGLSQKNKPVQLLTFNTDFYSHKEWLEKNNIFANHLSVLMLSKLKNKKDFYFVDKIFENHDGIWLNRFSRFSEPQHKAWMRIEQSSLPPKETIEFFEYIKNK